MGKHRKRDLSDEERIEKYSKKIRKLEEARKKSSTVKVSFEDKGDENSSPNTAAVPSADNSEKSSEEEIVEQIQDDGQWLEIIGEDPTESQALRVTVRADLLKRWQYNCRKGIKKEAYESLDKKYESLKELDAPKLNPQILATMKDFAVTRDKYMMDIQNIASKALSIVGSLMTSLYEDAEEMNLDSLLTGLSDTAKFLNTIVFKQSKSRKAFIEPGLSKETVAILKETEIGEFLYGDQLGEKIKEAKAIHKLGENLKAQQPNKVIASKAGKQPLNSRFPFVRRPITGQTGSSLIGGRQKPKQFFKYKQQFVNQNAQGPARQQMPQRQEKK